MKYLSFVFALILFSHSSVEAMSAQWIEAEEGIPTTMWGINPKGFLAGRGPTWFDNGLPSLSGPKINRYSQVENQWMFTPNPIYPRWAEGSCVHPDGSKMILYGGSLARFQEGNASAWVAVVDAISLDITELPPGQGPAVSYATCVVTPSNKVYYFGGKDDGGFDQPSRKTWTTDLVTGVTTMITPVGVSPSARYGHGAVWNGTAMIIYGGYNHTIYLNDIWAYNPSSNSWSLIPTSFRYNPTIPTSLRMIRKAFYFHGTFQGAWYIFGGLIDGGGDLSVMKFNMTTNTISQVQGLTLPGVIHHGTAVSMGNGVFYLRAGGCCMQRNFMKIDLNP